MRSRAPRGAGQECSSGKQPPGFAFVPAHRFGCVPPEFLIGGVVVVVVAERVQQARERGDLSCVVGGRRDPLENIPGEAESIRPPSSTAYVRRYVIRVRHAECRSARRRSPGRRGSPSEPTPGLWEAPRSDPRSEPARREAARWKSARRCRLNRHRGCTRMRRSRSRPRSSPRKRSNPRRWWARTTCDVGRRRWALGPWATAYVVIGRAELGPPAQTAVPRRAALDNAFEPAARRRRSRRTGPTRSSSSTRRSNRRGSCYPPADAKDARPGRLPDRVGPLRAGRARTTAAPSCTRP